VSNPLTPVPVPDYQPLAPAEIDVTPAPKFRLQKFLAFLLKFWWVPVVAVVLSLSGAGVYVLLQPPTFVSTASMWETLKLRLPEGSMFSEDMQNFLGTQSELLQSTLLRERTLSHLQANTAAPIPRDKNGEALPVAIRVIPSAKSSVFMLQATGSQAAYISNYLNKLMDVYLEYKKEIRESVSGGTLTSIDDQLQKAGHDLNDEQKQLSDFQRTNNLAILQEEATVASGYLTRLKTQLSDLQLENRLLQAATQSATNPAAGTNDVPLEVTAVTSMPGSTSSGSQQQSENQSTSKDLELLKIQRERLSKNLRPKHPKIVKLDADIERAEKLLDVFRRQNRQQLASAQAANQLKTENVRGSIDEWQTNVVKANAKMSEAERLKLNVQRAQSIYDRLAMLAQNVGISSKIDQETLAILQQASTPKRSDAREKVLVMAGFGGLGLGLGFIFLLAARDDRFGSVFEVNEKLGDAVVAQVPEAPLVEGKQPVLLENGEADHMYAESYRNLRSALLFLAIEGSRPKVILITSALPNEGKSTVAANLARTLAMGGARVLLVDADLRRGALHNLLGLSRGPGLAELLRQPEDADKLLQTNSLPTLRFIPAGTRMNNPGDLFLRPELDQLLAHWRKQFDYILIDSSPVFAADDAPTLAPKVDGTLFVVRSQFSGARQVREALELLQRRQAKVLGVVFNRANATARSYYYYKYSEYYGAPKDKGPLTTDH
jgi:capsular exopolysaccharide synthesis family protein